MRAQTTWRCCPTIAHEVRCRVRMERPVAVAAAAGGESERPDLPLSGSEWTRAPPRFNVVTKWEKGRSKPEGPAQKVEELEEEKTY